MKNWEFSMLVAPIGGAITIFLGGWDHLFSAALLFIVLDYITGVVDAGTHGQLNPRTGFYGILKKVLYFVPVALGNALDHLMVVGSVQPIRTVVLWFILANEGISILGHLGSLGVPIPNVLKTAIESLSSKGSMSQNPQPPAQPPTQGGGNGQ